MGCVMDPTTFTSAYDHAGFPLRRAVERLREGLYDPLAVRLLTAQREPLEARLQDDLRRLEAGEAVHLCVCGAYGQGKSHTLTYLRERSLEQGYVVSAINLDPRQTPLHLLRLVYQALLHTMTFPADSAESGPAVSLLDAWRTWATTQTASAENPSAALSTLLPAAMPHPFKAILVALAQPTLHVLPGQRILRQYRDYRPTEFASLLQRALMAEAVPVARLRPALKYRQVSFYHQAPLALQGDEPFVQMLETLPHLFHRMGYKGWVLLFDEAEAITQVRLPMRARSYRLLHRLLYPPTPRPGLYPVFAFTPGFFQQLHEEDYDLELFDRNYAQAWQGLSVYYLRGLSRSAWQEICDKLTAMHAAAYGWPVDHERLLARLHARLQTLPLQDPRATLKALVDELDQVQQQAFFAQRFGDED
jgi:P-loop Domain of unknown function (DUF2791)